MAVHTERIHGLALCAGIGTLELGLRFALGDAYRCVCMVEREAFAVATLVSRMEEGHLDSCPIWDNLVTFDGKPWRGIVDIVSAGLPCQGYSVAGKQRGNEDERSFGTDGRGPVYHALRIIGECRPAVVAFENVPLWISAGHFRRVGEELARLGYTVESPLFLSAANVGASHKRERVFVLAHCRSVGLADRWSNRWRVCSRRNAGTLASETRTPQSSESQSGRFALSADDGCATVGDGDKPRTDTDAEVSRSRRTVGESGGSMDNAARYAIDGQDGENRVGRRVCGSSGQSDGSLGNSESEDCTRLSGRAGEELARSGVTSQSGRRAIGVMDDADGTGSCGRSVQGPQYANEQYSESSGLPLNPPGPNDRDGWQHIIERWPWLAPAISEEEAESILRRMVDEHAAFLDFSHRVDRLRAAGNAVCSVQAATAFRVLLSRSGYLTQEKDT